MKTNKKLDNGKSLDLAIVATHWHTHVLSLLLLSVLFCYKFVSFSFSLLCNLNWDVAKKKTSFRIAMQASGYLFILFSSNNRNMQKMMKWKKQKIKIKKKTLKTVFYRRKTT